MKKIEISPKKFTQFGAIFEFDISYFDKMYIKACKTCISLFENKSRMKQLTPINMIFSQKLKKYVQPIYQISLKMVFTSQGQITLTPKRAWKGTLKICLRLYNMLICNICWNEKNSLVGKKSTRYALVTLINLDILTIVI